jgi:hypothetical protein
MAALFGPPALLGSEKIECYRKILGGLSEDFIPKTMMERLLIRNFADVTFDIFRIQRYKAALLERSAEEIRKAQSKRNEVKAQVAALQETEEPIKKQTKLQRIEYLEDFIFKSVAGLDNTYEGAADDLEYAQAFERKMEIYQELDIMETRCMRRRNWILKELERCMKGWGGHLKKTHFRDEVEFQETMEKARSTLRRKEAAANDQKAEPHPRNAPPDCQACGPDGQNQSEVASCHNGSASDELLGDHDGIPREGVLPNSTDGPPGEHGNLSGHDEVANSAGPGIDIPAAALNGQSGRPRAETEMQDLATGVTNGAAPAELGASNNHETAPADQIEVSVPPPGARSSPSRATDKVDRLRRFVDAAEELAGLEAADAREKDEERRRWTSSPSELDEEIFNALREKDSHQSNKRPQESRPANGAG